MACERLRAKLPPLVIGRIMGSLVIRLNASGDTISHDRTADLAQIGSMDDVFLSYILI
jgi:hypothetical protein